MTAEKRLSSLVRPRGSSFTEGDWNILARQWFPVAVAADLAAQPLAVRLLDIELVLYRSGSTLVAARDLCPHRGMRLSRGWVDAGEIICPYHGLHFATDGRCTSIPSRPDARLSDRLSLTVLPSVERYGLIWVTLLGEEPILPRLDGWEDAEVLRIVCDPLDLVASAGRQIEGFLDVAHFAWAHTGTFGNRANPVVPDYEVEPTERGLRVHYLSHVSNYGPDQADRVPADFLWRRTFEVFPPFCATLRVDFPDAKSLWILNAASPVSARETRLFCPIVRNFDLDGSVAAFREFNHRVFEEDRVLVENQKPEDLPLDAGAEIAIPADRTSVAYRRLLKQMGLSLVYAG
jgi:vanillate O-demethylase monooxygenase subunit